MNARRLWHCSKESEWLAALESYWQVESAKRNEALERELESLDADSVKKLDSKGWYEFLLYKYFKWKYTAPNRYATTTTKLKEYESSGKLADLLVIKSKIFQFDLENISVGLRTAKSIKGLGIAGASGLLSILFPKYFGTVDKFLITSLQNIAIDDSSLRERVANMNPDCSISNANGVKLIRILREKATELNRSFSNEFWTPRKIDKILWSIER